MLATVSMSSAPEGLEVRLADRPAVAGAVVAARAARLRARRCAPCGAAGRRRGWSVRARLGHVRSIAAGLARSAEHGRARPARSASEQLARPRTCRSSDERAALDGHAVRWNGRDGHRPRGRSRSRAASTPPASRRGAMVIALAAVIGPATTRRMFGSTRLDARRADAELLVERARSPSPRRSRPSIVIVAVAASPGPAMSIVAVEPAGATLGSSTPVMRPLDWPPSGPRGRRPWSVRSSVSGPGPVPLDVGAVTTIAIRPAEGELERRVGLDRRRRDARRGRRRPRARS